MICLETKHFGAALEMEFKTGFSSRFDEYRFELFNVMQNSWPGQLSFVVSTDGGANYDCRNVYKSAGWTKWTEGIRDLANNIDWPWGNVAIDMADDLNYGICGTMKLKTPGTVAGSAVHTAFDAITTRTDSGLNVALAQYAGFYYGALGCRVNAVKFFGSGATVTWSGMIRLYGVPNT